MIRTACNSVTELLFAGQQLYEDPYNEVEVDALVWGPEGEQACVPLFWGGDHLWRLRFAASRPGGYQYRLQSNRPEDGGLHGVKGEIEVLPYEGSNPLLRHGRLQVMANRRYFQHADGTPFLWTGDTWWMGLATRLHWPGDFQELTADRVAKGYNVVQMVVGPCPDMGPWDARGRNEGGYPFEEDYRGINPDYYDHADLKVAHLVNAGISPCLVGMWGYYYNFIGEERIKVNVL